ncbi:hypothetical protein NQZ79_g5658 [Umbelopsis isabellina]|nr:hypothetical protein NQZ79_g5658 [Umbelopsis isabellina]
MNPKNCDWGVTAQASTKSSLSIDSKLCPLHTTEMETILASSKEDSNEQMIIQQHDTVVNDCLKKDICSVTCSVNTPQNEDEPSINQGQTENTVASEAEPMQTDVYTTEVIETVVEVTETEQNQTSIINKSGEQTPFQSTLAAKAIDQVESNIDAAIATSNNGPENAQNGYESSDLESSDDEDEAAGEAVTAQSETSDSSDSDDSDDESDADLDLPTKSMSLAEREKALIDISWMDDEEGTIKDTGPLRTKNEIENIVVQRPTVTIKPEARIVEIGTVYAVVENTVVVQGHVSGDEQVLDSGSLFVFEDREILGEVKYQVARPLYSVRFNDASEIDTERTKQGSKVYNVPELSTFLLTRVLKMQKGSDASNLYDEEVDEKDMAFSDDEAENEHNRKLKKKRNNKKRPADAPPGPPAAPAQEADWDDLDGYNVLKRPALSSAPARQPHPLPPRPTFSMPPAEQSQQGAQQTSQGQPTAVHSISQLFAAGPPPLHPPPQYPPQQ